MKLITHIFFVCVLGDLREELDRLAKTCSDQQQLIHQAINKAPGTLDFNLSHSRLRLCTFFRTQALIICVLSQTDTTISRVSGTYIQKLTNLQTFNSLMTKLTIVM